MPRPGTGDTGTILPFARPAPADPPALQGLQSDPDTLARAIAALQGALVAELHRAQNDAQSDPPDSPAPPAEEPITPIGAPRTRALPQPEETQPDEPPRDPLARRILALHFPRFPLERWLREAARRGEDIPDDLPFALAAEGPHGPVIQAANRAAEAAGVAPGARVVDMRALCPALRIAPADPGADAAALARLMLWARRWCPWTATEGAAGLMMDVTGATHLWGGEAALLAEIEGRLATIGLTARAALAPTQGAAWALARYGATREICGAEALAARMAPLPVRALRLTPETVLLLQRLGLKTVGDLAALPRISLARRFSRAALPENPLLRLDQMMGRLAEPVSPPEDPPRFLAEIRPPDPLPDPLPHMPALARALCDSLERAGFGARRLRLTLYRSDGEVSVIEAATARPSRDAPHLARLFEGRLEGVDPGFGFDLLTLDAPVAEALEAPQPRLDGRVPDTADLARLVDRVSARFGPRALRRPAPRASHLPERAEDWPAAMAALARTAPPSRPLPARGTRPLRLFEPPEEVEVLYAVPEGPPARFLWRRVTHRVTRFAGPERLAPEWWRARPGTRLRDYYRIEDQHGLRFWICREGVLNDGRGTLPRWFVQGIFP